MPRAFDEANRARIKNDFEDRVAKSRARLESELRSQLRQLAESAERALARAREASAAGAGAIEAELRRIDRLRADAVRLGS